MFCLVICKWEKYLSCKKTKKLECLSASGRACMLSFQGYFPSLLLALSLKDIGDLHVFTPGRLGSGLGTGGLASSPALLLTGCVTWES